MTALHRLTDVPFVRPVVQPKLELQMVDGYKSRFCPVYSNAIKQSLYLAPEGEITVLWHGGTEVEVTYPTVWDESWVRARDAWLKRGLALGMDNPVAHRYRASRPIGDVEQITPHAGGITLNFFTGTSLHTPSGVKAMVIPPVNQFNYGWTLQSGLYDSDVYRGEFSINLQILVQGVRLRIRKHQPIATILFIGDQTPYHNVAVTSPGSICNESAVQLADDFYFRKSQCGLSYQKNLEASSAGGHEEKPTGEGLPES